MNDEPLRRPQYDAAKKPYSTPELRIYGDIREVTQNAGTSNPTADGPGMFSKTG